MSETPYTDEFEAPSEEFIDSVLVVPAEKCRKLERDRSELINALKEMLRDYDETLKFMNALLQLVGFEQGEETSARRARDLINQLSKDSGASNELLL